MFRANDETVRPVVVWIHGGSLVNGDRAADIPESLFALCRSEGYALASFDYRLAPEVKLSDIAADIDDAYAWLHDVGTEKLHVDTGRCVVTGGSAGGYLALLAGTRLKRHPRAIVAYWPFTDIGDVDGPEFVEWQRTGFALVNEADAYRGVGKKVLTGTKFGSDVAKARDSFVRYVCQNGLWTKEVAGLALTDRKKRELYSPVRIAKRDFPPTLLIHGAADSICRLSESETMAARLAQMKVPHQLITVPGAGHVLAGGDKQLVAEAHAQACKFIQQHLQESPSRKPARARQSSK